MFLLFVYVFLALLFSFLCSIAEAVLLSITPAYVEKLKLTDPEKAKRIKRLRFEDVDRSLAAILTLNTIAHTVGAIVAGAKATYVFGDAWIGVFSAVITVLILVFSEIIPKTIGAVYWQSLTGFITSFVAGLIKLLYPLIVLSEKLTKLISKGKKHHMFNRDEFIAMAGLGERTGLIEEHESRIINNLFKLSSLKARDIMTPRSVVTSFQQQSYVEDVFEAVINTHVSRLPVYQESMDDSHAFVLKSDVLMAKAMGENVQLQDLTRDLSVVIEDMSLTVLMDSLMRDSQHMSLVVTEYGDVCGLVTMEDVMETLLGLEIMDELDQVQDMQAYARKIWLKRAASRGMVLDEDLQQDNQQ
jgi:CBS domain containing-hemolysin-like protein